MPNDSAAWSSQTAATRHDITTATTNGRTVNRPRNRILCLPIKTILPRCIGRRGRTNIGRLPARMRGNSSQSRILEHGHGTYLMLLLLTGFVVIGIGIEAWPD